MRCKISKGPFNLSDQYPLKARVEHTHAITQKAGQELATKSKTQKETKPVPKAKKAA